MVRYAKVLGLAAFVLWSYHSPRDRYQPIGTYTELPACQSALAEYRAFLDKLLNNNKKFAADGPDRWEAKLDLLYSVCLPESVNPNLTGRSQ